MKLVARIHWRYKKNTSSYNIAEYVWHHIPMYSWHSPMYYFLTITRYDVIRYLVDNGAEMHRDIVPIILSNVENNKNSKNNNDMNMLSFVLSHGADINACNGDALSIAIRNADMNMIKYLISHGADVNNSRSLSLASLCGKLHIVQYLVENGAEVNNVHPWLNSALYLAVKYGNYNIVKYLIKHGADIHEYGLLSVAVGNIYIDIARYLISHGCDVNDIELNDLDMAIICGDIEIFKLLHEYHYKHEDMLFEFALDLGCDVNIIKYLQNMQ